MTEFILTTSFTYILIFLLCFIIHKSYEHSGQYTKRISTKISQLRSKFPQFSSSENARAAKAAKILDAVHVQLLDRYQVEETYSTDTWQRQAYDDFTRALIAKDKTFPCIYGTKGYKSNELDFLFLSSEDLNDIETAKVGAKAILEYHKILHKRGRNISLVLICPPPTKERTVEEYHLLFWSFLKRLRQLDPQPWPENIPHNTEDEKWCMNFDGKEAFFAVQTPAHKQRLSRFAPNFAIVYQPRFIFDVVFKDPRYRESATKMVRGLLDRYDAIERSPDISDYAVEGTTESRQYFLLDRNVAAVCPYERLDVAANEELEAVLS